MSVFTWQIAGYAGEGIKKIGQMFSKVALRHGFHTFDYTEYPSLIRGGHNVYQARYGPDPVYTQSSRVDVMVAMNKDGIDLHLSSFAQETIVLFDGADDNLRASDFDTAATLVDLPMVQLARSVGAERIAANMVALGASMYLTGLSMEVLEALIDEAFGHKSEKIVALNVASAKAGYDFMSQHDCQPVMHAPEISAEKTNRMSLTGNEALSLGAIAGGMKGYFAYPMTPSSSILHTLAAWAEEADILVKHAEDEIGVINMALGASYAGARVAVGTSGGGICYMSEAVGLAGIAELPLVIFESQRPGPAVGMPTWTGQADLLFNLFISQDEFPRIVMAPGDVREAFEMTRHAFELADEYQVPVIILSDKHLSESAWSTDPFDDTYQVQLKSREPNPTLDKNGMFARYTVSDSGVSPRSVPGQADGYYICNGYETDVYGFASEESHVRIEQMDKRMRKLDGIRQHVPQQFTLGEESAPITLVGWGSTKQALIAAHYALQAQDISTRVLSLSWMWPFPTDQILEELSRAGVTPILFEGNATHQLATLIRSQTGIDIYHKHGRYDGRPFYVEDIVHKVQEVLAAR